MDLKQLFIPITKVDAAQRLVYGLATAEVADKANEVCDYASTKPYYEKWSGEIAKATDGKSLGNLRVMHGTIAAGKLTQLAFNDDAKQIEICAKVVDDAEWRKVEEGVYTGFSHGGKYVKRWKDEADPTLTRYTAEPVEVSLVDVPCLPDATFSVVKADGTTELRKFAPRWEPEAADVAKRAMEMAKIAGHNIWHQEIDRARADLIASHKASNPTPVPAAAEARPEADPAQVAKAADTPVSGEEYEQVWQSRRDGKTFRKKADMLAHHAALDAEASARKVAGPVLDAVEKLAADVAKKDYTDDERKQMASEGTAMKDGGYPIADRKDLENAVQAYGRAKNKAATKRHIIKRAKALKATDLLPADWSGSTKSEKGYPVGKPMKGPGSHSTTVAAVPTTGDGPQSGEGMGEGGDPAAGGDKSKRKTGDKEQAASKHPIGGNESAKKPAPAKAPGEGTKQKSDEPTDLKKAASLYGVANLLQLLAQLECAEECCEYDDFWSGGAVNVPKELRDRFGAATVELGDIAADLLDLVLQSMAEEEAGEAMAMSAPIVDLIKIGARNSASDKERIKKVHDLAIELDPECCMGNDTQGQSGENDDDADKAAAADALAKMTAERDAMAKVLADLPAKLAEIGTEIARLREIEKTVKAIEAQPAVIPPRAGYVVNKDGTTQPLGGPAPAAPDTALTSVIDDPDVQKAMALAMIKRSHQNPQPAFGRIGA